MMSALTSAATAVKILFVVSLTAAFAGAHRLTTSLGATPLFAHAGALLYVGSPFVLTRVAVGHLSMVAVYAVLPWVYRILQRPSRSISKTTAALWGLGLLGFYGGLIALTLLVAGMVGERQAGRPVALSALAGRAVITQVIWFVPGILVLADGVSLVGPAEFPSGLQGPISTLSVLAGGGFWQPVLQVGDGDPAVAFAGLVLAGLATYAVVARRNNRADAETNHLATIGPAALALLVVAWDALPGLRSGFEALASIPGGSVLREPQRLLVLYLIWAAPNAAVGAQHLAERFRQQSTSQHRAATALPFVLGLVLVAPGLWGVHDRFETSTAPEGWNTARELIAAEPGTTLILPWYRYLDIGSADNRRTLNPAIRGFGPEILLSSDLRLGSEGRETASKIEQQVEALLPALKSGDADGNALAGLGVRWIVVMHEADYQPYLRLLSEPQLSSRLVDIDIDLLHNDRWQASSTDNFGIVWWKRMLSLFAYLLLPVQTLFTASSRPGRDSI